jgi:signal transduction histidine kinase
LIGAGILLVALVLLGAGPAPARAGGVPVTAGVLQGAGLLAGLLAVGYGGWALWRLAVTRRLRAARAAADLAARAVAEERLRIARELHDVVAHSMGVIAVKAGTARYLLSSRPEEAGRALEVIETASRGVIAELRQLLGLLRPSPDGTGAEARQAAAAGLTPSPGELNPLPDLSGLPGLAENAAAAGVTVNLDFAVTEAVPAGVGLSAYRIVQEAITNVVKHASPAICQVAVRADGSAVRIEVRDDGHRPVPARGSVAGHGLIGMRERAEMHGGSFSAGPAEGGGFAVSATLPFEPS